MDLRELGQERAVKVFEYRCRAEKGAPVEPEQFGFAAISLVRSGVFGFRSEGRAQLLSPGFALLANPGQAYEISHQHAGGDRCLIFRFQESALEEVVRPGPRASPRLRFARSVLPPSPRAEVLRRLAEDRLTSTGAALGLEEVGLSLAACIAGLLGRLPASGPRKSRSRGRLHEVLARLEGSSGEALRLGELAAIAGLSPYHFLRVFKREVGVTPHRYLVQARLRRALESLRDTRRPITEIAGDVGFGDLSNFINTFRREVGCSPARYRASPHLAFAAWRSRA
jgi:AraC-like DNA-binding protein